MESCTFGGKCSFATNSILPFEHETELEPGSGSEAGDESEADRLCKSEKLV